MNLPQDASFAGALAGLLVAATAFLRREIRNSNGPKMRERIEAMAWKVEELHRMHDVRDSSGRPVWYIPPDFDRRLEKLLEVTEQNAHTTERLVEAVKRLCDHLAKER